MVVVGGVLAGEFLSQGEAERAYNVLRGLTGPPSPATSPSPVAPEPTATMAPCGHGEPSPVVGGYWRCDPDGYWRPTSADDPRGQADPPAPRPGTAPVSPSSGPGMPGEPPRPPAPTSSSPTSPIAVVDRAAAALHVTRTELAAVGILLGAAVLARR